MRRVAAQRVIAPLDPHSEAAAPLLHASAALLNALYPPASAHVESAHALARPNVLFLGAWEDGEVVGCGAVRQLDDDGAYGEIKRLFVPEAHRGGGVGTALVAALESHLRSRAVWTVRLETGIRQPEALQLYRRLGYRERAPFGAYGPDPWSVFMEKSLR